MNSDEVPGARHEFSWFTLFLCWLAGVDPEVLAHCPPRDVHNVKTVAWLMMAAWLWQAVMFTLAGHMLVAEPGERRLEIVAAALLLATIVLLADSYLFVRPSWYLQGVAELERGGLKLPGTTWAKVTHGLSILLRLFTLSLALAQLLAIFFSLLIYEKDLSAELDREQERRNREIYLRATTAVDGAIGEAAAEHTRLQARIGELHEEEKKLRHTAIEGSAVDPEMEPALARVKQLAAAVDNAAAELEAAEKFASDELAGIRSAKGHSGQKGHGPVRRAADERVQNARKRLELAKQDFAAADAKVAALRQADAGSGGRKREMADAKLAELQATRTKMEERLLAVEAALNERRQNRERDIRKAVEGDPAYAKKEDGFLARWQALQRLMEEQYAWVVVLLLDVALFAVECAAFMSKTMAFIPATYATIIARDDILRGHREAADLVRQIEAITRREESEKDEPEPEQQERRGRKKRGGNGRDGPGANETATPSREAEMPRKRRGRPPGRRWRPELRPGDDAQDHQDPDSQ
jgi:hypothetical protein